MKNSKLIWDEEKEYWYCSNCGAIYHQPQNWKPNIAYCMKCKIIWEESD